MATAGMPPIARPAKARVTRSADQLGAKAPAMVSSAEAIIEVTITVRRPNPSAKAAATMMASDRQKVESDKASELSAAPTL